MLLTLKELSLAKGKSCLCPIPVNPNLKNRHHFLLNVLVDLVSRLISSRWHDFRNLSMNQPKWRKTISNQVPSVLVRWLNMKYLKGRIYRVGKEAQWVKMLYIIVRELQFDAPESHKSQNFTVWSILASLSWDGNRIHTTLQKSVGQLVSSTWEKNTRVLTSEHVKGKD